MQRISEMRGIIAGMDALDDGTILSGMDPVMQERLSYDRIRPRMVMRRGRRIAPKRLFAPVLDAREQSILSGGSGLIETLSHAIGVHILWQDVVRLVRRSDLEALDVVLGVSSREIALLARENPLAVEPIDAPEEKSTDLAEKVRREGALGWACWLAACDPAQARRLRVFTPASVSSEVIGGLPGDPKQRNLRRRVVEFEIDQHLKRVQAEMQEGELQ